MFDNLPTHHRIGWWATLFTVSVIMAFLAGYWTSQWRHEDRVQEQAMERFKEFISVGTGLGVVTVDQGKLAELECIVAESAWADDDISTCTNGGKQ